MKRIVVTGCGTDVGKTVVSAILVEALQAEYWKPVQCGSDSDSEWVGKVVANRVHEAVYTLQAPLSPHHAARLEGVSIDPGKLRVPQTACPLVIETSGGVLVPFHADYASLDLYQTWQAAWIIVSRHYLGSINHTLLTLEVLRNRGVDVRGVVFNGMSNPDTEEAILGYSQVPCAGRLNPEDQIDSKTIQRYARLWKAQLMQILP